ncbi:MAG: hypothetical protein J4432_00105 [DPANN group archaeon]|nr:hypothetical protein [DPANN group archaeon]
MVTTIDLPLIIGAAIIDGINPCAFGVLIFMIGYLSQAFKSSSKKFTPSQINNKILVNGTIYIAAVFLTYLVAGLILLPVIRTIGAASVVAYQVIGAIIILFGLLEIKDFFWYGKGPSLSILPGQSARIHAYTERVGQRKTAAFLLGVFVALVELPCTGAVYLGVLALMSLSGLTISNLTFLLLYNVIFIIPLFIILGAFFKGSNVEWLEAWRKRHRGLMRLFIGSLLVGMGVWMFMILQTGG